MVIWYAFVILVCGYLLVTLVLTYLVQQYPRRPVVDFPNWANPVFGRCFGPAILGWMNLFYRGGLDRADPCRRARAVDIPVMLIQGENDRRFPVAFARRLSNCFRPGPARLYVAAGAGHSNSSAAPDYPVAVKGFRDRHAVIPTQAPAERSN